MQSTGMNHGMTKIAIIGSGGSGKSVLARQLGGLLNIEVVHLDAVHWKPGWVEPPDDEWRETVESLVTGESWIIDGNYGGTMEIRLSAADTVIFLDFPRWLCVLRVIKRRFQYRGRDRPDMAPGCPEKIDWAFLKWVWGYRTRSRPRVLQRLEQYRADKRVIILRGAAGVRSFLRELASVGG